MTVSECMVFMKGVGIMILIAAISAGCGGVIPTVQPDVHDLSVESFHKAVERRDIKTVDHFIKQGMDVNAREDSDRNALWIATRNDDANMVQTLIKAGADVNTANNDGETALMTAALTGELESIRMLVDAKADVNAADRIGRTALINAAGMRRSSMESFKVEEQVVTAMVEVLLSAGADVNTKTQNEGYTALHAAAKEGHTGAAALLIKAGADVNAKTKLDKFTPLMEAAKDGNAELVKLLLKSGAKRKITDRLGRTAAKWGSDHPERTWALVAVDAVSQAYAAGSGEKPGEQTWIYLLTIDSGMWLYNAMFEYAHLGTTRQFIGMMSTLNDGQNDALAASVVANENKLDMLENVLLSMSPNSLLMEGTFNDINHYADMPPMPLEQITTPTLIVHGTADGDVPPDDAINAASKIAGAELCWVEGGVHVVTLSEDSDVAMRKVLDFLKQHSPE